MRLGSGVLPFHDKERYEAGSRNVFKDIGVPHAEEHFVKARSFSKSKN
jgi:hypothetical protein